MDIPPDFRPIDHLARRRAAEGGSTAPRSPAAPGSREDAFEAPDTAAVTRLAAQAKASPGTDPAKLKELRTALADGSYTADPEELVDPLLDRLDPPPRQA